MLQTYLTHSGEQRWVAAVEERIVKGLNRSEQKQLIAWLRQCCEALEKQG